MALTPDQDALFQTAKAALPAFLFQKDSAKQEILQAFAVLFDHARAFIDTLLAQYTHILAAPGPWLDAHAKERGIYRQAGETDAVLAQRVRSFQDVLTRPLLLSVIRDVLDAVGLGSFGYFATDTTTNRKVSYFSRGYRMGGRPGLVELRRDRGYFCTPVATGRKSAYFSRGYRMGHSGRPANIIAILPKGTTSGVQKAVDDQVRVRKAGGIGYSSEVPS